MRSGIIKPRPPILNRSLPLSRGLASAYVFYEGSGATVHDMGLLKNHGTASGHIWSPGYMDFTEAGKVEANPITTISGSHNRTVIARIRPQGDSFGTIVQWGQAGTNHKDFNFLLDGYDLRIAITSGTYTTSLGTTNQEWNNVAVRLKGTQLADLTFYLGSEYENGSGSTVLDTGTVDNLTIAASPNDLEVDVEYVYIYDRALPRSAILSIFADPYQMFLPRSFATLAITAAPSPPGTTDISITWTDNSENETGYELQRTDDGGTTWDDVTDAIAADAESYTDSGVDQGQTYQYRLRALNATKGNSEWAYSDDVTV